MSGPSARPSAQARFDHSLFEYTRGLRTGKAANQRPEIFEQFRLGKREVARPRRYYRARARVFGPSCLFHGLFERSVSNGDQHWNAPCR